MKSVGKPGSRGESAPVEGPPNRSQPSGAPVTWTSRGAGKLVLVAGWLLPQILLLGPALVGWTINLPLDLLATPHLYLPNTPEYRRIVPHHGMSLLDLVVGYPASREFATKEFRSGRLPLWQPANFAGTPFAGWPKYSLFESLHYIFPSPVTLAWISLIQTLTCGLGMWLFLRLALRLSYWPSAIASWCAPLTGFMTLWQGHLIVPPVCWLPWSLLLVHRSIKAPWSWNGIGLAVVTALLILSGGVDMSGLVLISTGLYAVWLLATEELPKRQWSRAASAAAGISVAWLVGIMLATPYLLPLQDYLQTSARVQARATGSEERPPVGLSALPAVILPDVYGSDSANSFPLDNHNRLESSSGACAGLLALLWLAPLGWFHPRYRREAIFFTLLAIAGIGWTLDLPALVPFLRIKPLNMFSYNRWVFATADSILVLTALGLEFLLVSPRKFTRPYLFPVMTATGFGVVIAVFGLWCLARCLELPEPLLSQLERAIRTDRAGGLTLERLHAAQRTFTICYALGAGLSCAALLGWLTTFSNSRGVVRCRVALLLLVPTQLIWFCWVERRQADRDLYFPKVAALEKLAALPPGRIWGVDCLPPNMNQFCGLEDVRGYDAVDPSSYVKLFDLARDPARSPPSPYALTQEALPMLVPAANHRFKLHPVADLLNVRYLVLRSPPPADFPVVVHQDDYWVIENRDVLPRAFVPRSVRVVANDDEALGVMRSNQFNPRETVLMSTDPKVGHDMQGTAAIRYESPTHASLAVDLRSDGIVVVSDMWDPGWRATLDGIACPILRVDTALRGFRVPTGKHSIELTYAPSSVRRSFQMSAAGGVVLLIWSAGLLFKTMRLSRKA